MAFQPFSNSRGILLHPGEPNPYASTSIVGLVTDAAGESVAIIGHINLSSGFGTTKTLSAAGGGKIHWFHSSSTFANGTTVLRIGVNDVAVTGLEDGTHDVYGELVGGVDTLTVGMMATPMGTGSKDITDGDYCALVIEMTGRGGVDTVSVGASNTSPGQVQPYGTTDTGAGPVRSIQAPYIGIEFDDGTFGWFDNFVPYRRTVSATFGSSSTPDEYALVFRLPFPAIASGLFALLGSLISSDDFELILYSDPLGTPVAERVLAQDMTFAGVGCVFSRRFSTADGEFTLEANTDYAIALKPTTTNTLTFLVLALGTDGSVIRRATPLGLNWSQYSRTNESGPFTNQDAVTLPQFGIWLSEFDDGTATVVESRAWMPVVSGGGRMADRSLPSGSVNG